MTEPCKHFPPEQGEDADILLLGLEEWLRGNHPEAYARYRPALHTALRALTRATPPAAETGEPK